ncbi:GNAT family N-acetyltransferase [Deefgea piscis]|uniref:GNAT family N-acetyltransferase n=1 Tax=Deefgea piscis TaxID=2739061 RepID=A0A6M8ST37_9NEIS|nr:arsenic resistance N-acetyltransferase ArsN2 [Deefgea piscis]QKJ67294.1 GNAT family N-acetyltransferase [Deefgea piscis]
MQIKRVSDLAEITRLLDDCNLKSSDVAVENLPVFCGIKYKNELIAIIGLEIFEDVGLLRSLAVAAAFREKGLATSLVLYAEDQARQQGVKTLYLLTNTAEKFFLKASYQITERNMAPIEIQATSQFSSLCPLSSAFLSKQLTN